MQQPVRMVVPFPPGGEPTVEFARFVQAETQRWGKVVRDSGVSAE